MIIGFSYAYSNPFVIWVRACICFVMKFSETHPHAFGMLATALGVLVFVPDALLLRLIGGDVLVLAFWRGLLAGSVFLLWSYFVSGVQLMSLKQSLSGPYLLIALFEGASVVLLCASIGHTSVSNTLFIFSTAPFIAAVLSWVFYVNLSLFRQWWQFL